MIKLIETATELKNMDFDKDERREIIEQLGQSDPTLIDRNELDFTALGDSWRFIRTDVIDQIQQEELSSDPYILGCFNASFLSSIINLDTESIELLQKSEGYEGIGKAVINGGHIEELQQDYVSADGYGHHFAHYDHEEHELTLNGETWHAFKVN